ncbi:MAG TPA: sialidase family protein [Anaerolineaceae bacterium]
MRTQAIFLENLESPSCHAATIVETRTGLLAAWFAGTHEGNPDVAIWLSQQDEAGWSAPRRVADVPGVALWNPVLFRDARETIWLFYKIGPGVPAWTGAYIQSLDEGKTWSEPVILPAGLLGPAKNKPVLLQNGDILCGTSAETWNSWACWVELSSDGGRAWRKIGPITAPGAEMGGLGGAGLVSATWDSAAGVLLLPQEFPGVIQPAVWEYAPGKLRMLMRATLQVGRVCLSESLDGGFTWSPARQLDVPNPNSGLDAVRLQDGRIALVCNPVKEGRTPLSLLVSEDNGETFPIRIDLETAPGEYSYPSIIQAKDGVLHTVATYQRRRIVHYLVELADL